MTLDSNQPLVRPDEGLTHASIFADRRLFSQELERVFQRTWLFLAHESEIPEPGDFVTRSMGLDPVIVARGRDGQIRVFLNVCRHRARQLTTEDVGNCNHFQCPYHGWTYTNAGELTGIPFYDVYNGRLDRNKYGLVQPPRVESYHGLVFASWQADGGTLSDNLGSTKWLLDMLFGRSDTMAVSGPPIRWIIDSNWKLGAANFSGDGTHIFTTHGFTAAMGVKPTRPNRVSYSVKFTNGHVSGILQSSGAIDTPFLGLPPETWPEIERRLDPAQFEFMRNMQSVVGNLFPNLSILNSASHHHDEWGGPEGVPVSFLSLRQWQPVDVDKTEVLSWHFVDKAAPAEWQELSQALYTRSFGPGGVFEQDDAENWSQIAAALKGPMAQKLWLNYGQGLGNDPTPEWTGPGTAHTPMDDSNERAFYQRWQELMAVE